MKKEALSLAKATLEQGADGPAKGKHIVFGLIKRGGNVYTQVVSNCSLNEFYPIIVSKVSLDSTIYTDGFKIYDGLADFGYQKRYRVQHGNNEFANGHNHTLTVLKTSGDGPK